MEVTSTIDKFSSVKIKTYEIQKYKGKGLGNSHSRF